MKGCYVLVIKLEKDQNIVISKLGSIFFKKGYYFYVGSALNNLEKRIRRHLSSDKKFHWHIDYLLKYSKIVQVFIKENKFREECIVAQALIEKLESIPGFGCSDCKCKSHLFYGSYNDTLQYLKDIKMTNFST